MLPCLLLLYPLQFLRRTTANGPFVFESEALVVLKAIVVLDSIRIGTAGQSYTTAETLCKRWENLIEQVPLPTKRSQACGQRQHDRRLLGITSTLG